MNKKISIAATLVTITVLLAACGKDPKSTGRIFMPDMTYSVAYETYAANPLFESGVSALEPVHGTIPRGLLSTSNPAAEEESAHKSYMYKYYYPDSPEGYEAAGIELKNPVVLNDLALERGKHLYTVFCSVCHGETGDGQGPIVISGAYPPVPAYSNILPPLSEGKMFHSITYGKNLMGAYASQVNPEDRWKVIYYIQKLSGVGRFAEEQASGSAQ